ncbi:MAG: chemotaxis protein CheW [Acidobacteriota bacterium]
MADSQLALLVFDISDQTAALPLVEVERIVPIAQLAHPPGSPSVIEGVLNLGGVAISVLRLDRLLGLPLRNPGLYSMVVLLKGGLIGEGTKGLVALLVDRVKEIRWVPQVALLPVGEDDSFNGCSRAAVLVLGQPVHVLSSQRLLLAHEARTLAEFQQIAQQRLSDWEARPQ